MFSYQLNKTEVPIVLTFITLYIQCSETIHGGATKLGAPYHSQGFSSDIQKYIHLPFIPF